MGAGKAQLGLDWATVVSLLLAASMAPRAYKTRKPLPLTLAGVGTVMAIKMANEAYSLRHSL